MSSEKAGGPVTAEPGRKDTGEGVPMLDLARQWATIEDEVLEEIRAVYRDGDFILGRRVEALEHEVADYCGVPHAVGVASGTDALLLALRGVGVGRGAEVVTTPFTFFATAGAIWNAGARPVFVDIEPDTFNMTSEGLDAAITSRTRAVVPIHLFGRCARMDRILDVTVMREVAVVEDAAQAIGAEYRGMRAGSMGDAAAFSFYPSKNLGGAGDGGMITTHHAPLQGHLRRARNHGQGERYHHVFVGTNSRLDGLQAATLRPKLRRLDEWNDHRRAHAARYDAAFADLDAVRTPPPETEGRHVYNQYTLRCARRDELQAHLRERGIGCAVYYPMPLHLQPCFQRLGLKQGQFPESEKACREVLSIPVYPELTEAEQERVIAAVRGFYGA